MKQTTSRINEINDLTAQIRTALAVEVLVEGNEGTYGAAEAVRKVGCGEARFADYRVYETVGGVRRREGCDAERAPGRARKMGREEMKERRDEVAAMRKKLAAVRRALRGE